MSRCDWLYRAAVRGFLIAVLLGVIPALAQENKSTEQPKTDQTEDSKRDANPQFSARIIIEKAKPDDTNWADPKCDQPQSHDEADLCEQRRMSKAANQTVNLNEIQTGIGTVGGLALVVTLFLTIFGTRAAIKSVNIMERTAERQLRAYIHIENIDFIGTNIRIIFKNYGSTPAYRVHNRCDSSLNLAGNPRFVISEKPTTFYDLGPGQSHTTALVNPQWTVELVKRAISGDFGKFYVFGEITYFDVFQDIPRDEPRVTRYRVELARVADDTVIGSFVPATKATKLHKMNASNMPMSYHS